MDTENEERAMVVQRVRRWQNGQRVEALNHFPPQKVHVLLANEDIADETKAMRRMKSHVDVGEVIGCGLKMNRDLNASLRVKADGRRQFETVADPVKAIGYSLNSPVIIIRGLCSDTLSGSDWWPFAHFADALTIRTTWRSPKGGVAQRQRERVWRRRLGESP